MRLPPGVKRTWRQSTTLLAACGGCSGSLVGFVVSVGSGACTHPGPAAPASMSSPVAPPPVPVGDEPRSRSRPRRSHLERPRRALRRGAGGSRGAPRLRAPRREARQPRSPRAAGAHAPRDGRRRAEAGGGLRDVRRRRSGRDRHVPARAPARRREPRARGELGEIRVAAVGPNTRPSPRWRSIAISRSWRPGCRARACARS